MARKAKCPICGKMNEREEAEEYKKKFYCPECIDKKPEEKERVMSDWDELYEYITLLYGEKPTVLMFKQMADYRKTYGFTDKGMYLTLKYFHEVLGNPVKEDAGLGIIVYMYDKAKKNFIENMEISNHNIEFEHIETVRKIEVSDKFNRKRHIKTALINFNEIED